MCMTSYKIKLKLKLLAHNLFQAYFHIAKKKNLQNLSIKTKEKLWFHLHQQHNVHMYLLPETL